MIRLTKVSQKNSAWHVGIGRYFCCDPSRRIYLCGGSQRCRQINVIQIALERRRTFGRFYPSRQCLVGTTQRPSSLYDSATSRYRRTRRPFASLSDGCQKRRLCAASTRHSPQAAPGKNRQSAATGWHVSSKGSLSRRAFSGTAPKKVAIARAIVTDPAVLIADEPTANLDAKSAVEVMKLLLRINQVGATILLATHDSTMVNTVRNRVVELQNGRLVRDEYQGGYTRFADPKDTYVW